MNAQTCSAAYKDTYLSISPKYSLHGTLCTRPIGHRGDHQNWSEKFRLTWDGRGGSTSSRGHGWTNEVYTCSICGQSEEWHWAESVVRHSLDYCFKCNFWVNLIRADLPNRAVINGRHYDPLPGRDGKMGSEGGGFGGATHLIRYHDGRSIRSRNVWTQGDVPEWFRDFLPDNAEFVRAAVSR